MLHRLRRRIQTHHGNGKIPHPNLGKLLELEGGHPPAGDDVEGDRGRDALHQGLDLLQGLRGFDVDVVGAGLGICDAPCDHLLEPCHRTGVGPRSDHHVRVLLVPRFDGRLDLLDHLFGGDDLFSGHVPAALGPNLVFQPHPGGPDPGEVLHRPIDVERVPVAGVDVHIHGQGNGAHDGPYPLEHLVEPHKTDIGLTDEGGGDPIAGRPHDLETRSLDEDGRERIVGAGPQRHHAFPLKVVPKRFGLLPWIHYSSFHMCSTIALANPEQETFFPSIPSFFHSRTRS